MPLRNKGAASHFAAAARILFDSAQKVGAIAPIDRTGKQYSEQLSRFYLQNHKAQRDGALGGVSLKVAEFLSAQRASGPAPRPVDERTGGATKPMVPLLHLPTLAPKPLATSSTPQPARPPHVTAAVAAKATARFVEPYTRPPPAQPATNSSAATTTPPVAAAASPPAEPAAMPEVMILEDKPLFEVRPRSEPAKSSVVTQAVQTTAAPTPRPARRKAKPTIVVPVIAAAATAKASSPTATPAAAAASPSPTLAGAVSVDSWELQREKELERLRRRQEEEEQRRLVALRAEEERVLGMEWVAQRSREFPRRTPVSAEARLLETIFEPAHPLADTFAAVEQLVKGAGRASPMLASAIATVSFRLRLRPPAEKIAASRSFLQLLETLRVSADLIGKARLALAGEEEVLAAYRALPATVAQSLDAFLVHRVITALLQHREWEEAIRVLEHSRSYLTVATRELLFTLTRNAHQLEEAARTQVVAYATKRLQELGKVSLEARLELALLEPSFRRRQTLQQLAASDEADERIFGELILRSDREEVSRLLEEMKRRGLNCEDLAVMRGRAYSILWHEGSMEVFDEVGRQVDKVGLRPMHVDVVMRAMQANSSEECMRSAADLLKKVPQEYAALVLRRVLPILYNASRFDLILELYDHFRDAGPLAELLPRASAFINEALRRADRAPISSVTLKDINYVAQPIIGTTTTSTAPGGGNAAVTARYDLAAITERMLGYAKEKSWAAALQVVQDLQLAPDENAAAVTLLYNCALGAAVEEPAVMQQVYHLMKERGVRANTTTVNTMLSALSKAQKWQEAIAFYDDSHVGQRDSNTYLMQLALLGKHSLWQEAVAVFHEARRKLRRPTVMHYGLAIGATVDHSWQDTLSIFEDMVKQHGAGVKESVVHQVMRCLERNHRSAELAKVTELAKKARRKS